LGVSVTGQIRAYDPVPIRKVIQLGLPVVTTATPSMDEKKAGVPLAGMLTGEEGLVDA